MTAFHRKASQKDEPGFGRASVDGVGRMPRFAGRVLLWGCVLLLLIRGALSLLGNGSRAVTTTRGATVTVTQPVSAEPSNARRK
jgi:hypothetical protein